MEKLGFLLGSVTEKSLSYRIIVSLEQGLSIFSHAFAKYSLSPSPKHYSCMADMLVRAGDVSHAFNILSGLPSAGAWGSLLSACRSYGNCELREMALSWLTELDDSPTRASWPLTCTPWVV